MKLDELRIIVLNERETGRLSEMPPDLYEKVREHLQGLQEQVYACRDPLSDQAQTLMEEVAAMRETIRDIFRIRSRKVLSLAALQTESHIADRDEIRKMLPAEREMYDGIARVIEAARQGMVAGVAPRIEGDTAAVPAGTAAGTEIPAAADTGCGPVEPLPVRLVRILQEIDPFVGIDGRIYALRKEDVVTLPARNADVLVERNIALNITPGTL
jgi:DNA replication factor GINS